MTPTELRKLRNFTEFIRKYLKAMDAQMRLPSTYQRGQAIAKLHNMLEEANSRIRYFLLDIDYRTEKSKKPATTSDPTAQIKRGTRFRWSGAIARVMVVSDGYAMARLPNCIPFAIRLTEVVPKLHHPERPDGS